VPEGVGVSGLAASLTTGVGSALAGLSQRRGNGWNRSNQGGRKRKSGKHRRIRVKIKG
jgi:hypothetical protein